MQIILLSGGSGKRLWPLSNGTRSKQFLPLLSSPTGQSESMVQRVVRQLSELGMSDHITVATSEEQKDSIINQLGDDLRIVTEPELRDTFPAIVLACSNLSMVQQCPDDEVVIVLPCDTYAESDYLQAVKQMAAAVANDVAELLLMGVKPTYATAKYGYVIPREEDQNRTIQRVDHFIEKPEKEYAEKLISKGALWNGGVFAFRLGYIKRIASQYFTAKSYEEVEQHYVDLPTISFDYAVVEKAKSLALVTYAGEWKDLGSWNTVSDELHEHVIGNVVHGEIFENTHVINELDIPIYCNGVEDMVIASSPDGIMVCRKNCTENITDYVDNLSVRPMYEERRWGSYQVLKSETYADGTKYLTKSLKIKPGKFISYQVHHHRKEIWTITEGCGIVVVDGVKREVRQGDVVVIEQGQKHCIKATEELEIIEVQLGTELVESDIQRFEWHW